MMSIFSPISIVSGGIGARAELIQTAHRAGRKIGICGQAPSDYPEFAAFLVEQGIDSIRLSPNAVVRTRLRILEVERALVV
ncbi:MAG TPA: putative PEP-binding protein [Herpetosiphonaceae bacterium]